VVSLDAKGQALRYLEDLSSPCFSAVTQEKEVLPCTCLWIGADGKTSYEQADSCGSK